MTTASTTLPGADQTPAERKPGYYVKLNLFALAIIAMAVVTQRLVLILGSFVFFVSVVVSAARSFSMSRLAGALAARP